MLLLNLVTQFAKMLDYRIVDKLVEIGYPRDYMIKSVMDDERNYATTWYYLLAPEVKKEFDEVEEDSTE
jgi:hypothetical protein